MINYNMDCDHNESRFSDIAQYDEIYDSETIHELIGDPIILSKFKTGIDVLIERIVDVASCCWNIMNSNNEKLQHTQIKFKVTDESEVTLSLPLNRFMMSLIYIKPVISYITDDNIKDYILESYMTDKRRIQIQDSIVKTLSEYGYTISEIKEIIATVTTEMQHLLLVFAQADIQILDADNLFLDHYKESPIIREINNTEYQNGVQTKDIVENNKRLYKILEKEMIERGNPFFLNERFTKILKSKQMEELYINFSQIPDGRDIIPVIMNGNGFKAGYHDKPVLYAGAIAARVPDMMNEEYMGQAGYFSRNLMILTYGTLSKSVYDCGSRNPVPFEIDELVLEMMDGRFYYENKHSGVLKVLDGKDKSNLGKKVWFRSPCTCNLNEDCCHVCYGTKALKVGNLKGGFIYTTELLTSNVQHNVLKAKHLLKADAERFEFSDNFENYFSNESSIIVPVDEAKFDILVDKEYRELSSKQFKCLCGAGKKKDLVTFGNYANIYIPEEMLEKCKTVELTKEEYDKMMGETADERYKNILSAKGEAYVKKLSDEEKETPDVVEFYKLSADFLRKEGGIFCHITPINIMETQRYMELMKLFENDFAKFDNLSDAIYRLMKGIRGIIPLLSTHAEIILGKLIRDVDNRLLRPNFLIEGVPYQIVRLQAALQYSESATTGLAFEQTRYHLLSSLFDERNTINRVGPRSFSDFLFGEEYAL